jgi:hypothetical protein
MSVVITAIFALRSNPVSPADAQDTGVYLCLPAVKELAEGPVDHLYGLLRKAWCRLFPTV